MRPVSDKKLISTWAQAVKERAGYKCEVADCNVRATQLHAHHVFHRSHANLRYEIDNGLCLCAQHHSLGSFSAHKDPTFIERIISTGVRDRNWLDDLIGRRRVIVKNNNDFKQKAKEKLEVYL